MFEGLQSTYGANIAIWLTFVKFCCLCSIQCPVTPKPELCFLKRYVVFCIIVLKFVKDVSICMSNKEASRGASRTLIGSNANTLISPIIKYTKSADETRLDIWDIFNYKRSSPLIRPNLLQNHAETISKTYLFYVFREKPPCAVKRIMFSAVVTHS